MSWNPFSSKDKPDDNKSPSPPTVKQGDLRVPIPHNPGSVSGQRASGVVQGAGATAQPGQAAPPVPKPPSITFDGFSVEAIKGSFVRMANAFDELKRLNEEHKKIQESNFKLFSGEKDREIADLRKNLGGLQATVADRDKEIVRKQQALDDSASDLNRLHKNLFEKSEEVLRREREIVEVRNEIAGAMTLLADEQSAHEVIKEAHKSLQDSETALKTKQSEHEATIAERNGQLEANHQTIDGLRKEMECLRATMSRRLAQFLPSGILESRIGAQVIAFDDEAASGDSSALRVVAGLSQLRAAFVPGVGPDDRLAALKSIGSALYDAWSGHSKDAKFIHAHFSQWQDFLNSLPGAGYQLVVPDLGQPPTTNVTAPSGITKVSEVQLWIIKAADGGIYASGVVR